MQKRLFIVSNRLPVTITGQPGSLEVQRSSGGLVAAISSFLADSSVDRAAFEQTFWVGVPGCSPKQWDQLQAGAGQDEFSYLPVFANAKAYQSYYNGFSNSVLWPLCHYFPSYAEYDSEYYESYLRVNENFLEVLRKHALPGDTVWIHDYHLMPLSQMLREAIPGITIGFFLHIPFPSYEIFRIMPKRWQEGILRGMLGADLVGFHTIDYATHFLKCVQMILGIEDNMHMLCHENRLVKIDVFPISIDYQKFSHAYSDPRVAAARDMWKQKFNGQKLIFSADRLDYTKGVFSRLKAYEHFLTHHADYREKVVFVMIVVPSRDTISKYAERKKMIDEYIGDINSRIGTIHWQPVIYQYSNLDFEELIAMYTSCDLALITPLRDGMNLVAKEFVASRKDLGGVLVLSDMTGAVRELTDALIINPNDIEDISAKILQGLSMSADEQRHRITSMQERISVYDVRAWARDYMSQLDFIKAKQTEYEVKFLDNDARHKMFRDYQVAGKRLLLLDYDGTLVPFSSLPSQAVPSPALTDVLSRLSKDPRNIIYIISGRNSETLDEWLGHLNIHIISEHGAKFRAPGGAWEHTVNGDTQWKPAVARVLDRYVKRCAHSFVEMKDYSVAWHYRNAHVEQANLRASELYAELTEQLRGFDLQILKGNKVIEVRSMGIDKGHAVRRVIGDHACDFILCFGDDRTDEDMFRVLAENPIAYTIKVGAEASFAKYNLHTSYMVQSMLETIVHISEPASETTAIQRLN